MNLRVIGCVIFGATIGLLAATWQARPAPKARDVDRPPVVDAFPNHPSCCSDAGASRAAQFRPGRSEVRTEP